MLRILTHKEEQAIRLCHQDHQGVSVESAAATMDITVANVKRHLRNAEKKAPQLFPILTPQHRAILALYDRHTSRKAIAEGLGISEAVLGREVTFLREKGFLFNRGAEQYDPSMDSQVKERF